MLTTRELTSKERVQEDLRLFFIEWSVDNAPPLVKYLNDTIFMLSFVENDLFTSDEIREVCMVLKRLSIILEDRVRED
jgi:hypothetical protein